MKPSAAKLLIVSILLLPITYSHAGPYTDDLSRCLVDSTSKRDRATLVKWMFSAASLHPAVKDIAKVSETQLNDANRQIANLFMKLLTESCRQETKKAVKYEGKSTIEHSFRILGQVAGQELFTSPEVAAGMSSLEEHLDEEKLKSLLEG